MREKQESRGGMCAGEGAGVPRCKSKQSTAEIIAESEKVVTRRDCLDV